MACDCFPAAFDRRTIQPANGTGAEPVVVTRCDCDRRQCATCHRYVWDLNGKRCPVGHAA